MIRGGARDAVLEAITEAPGISKTDIQKATGYAWGTIHYHLDKLVELQRVQCIEFKGRMHLFPPEFDSEAACMLVALREAAAAETIQALQEGPSRLHQLAERIGTTSKVMRRHLGALKEQGVIDSHGSHRPVYHLTTKAKRVMGHLHGHKSSKHP